MPLIARGRLKGTLNIYRVGEDAAFSDEEFLLAKRFGDAAALAIDNAHIRARLEHQAETDALTGLYNHRAFHDRLRQALLEASAAHETVAVVMLDLDDFKKVNDVYGHGVGDQLLHQVADVLRASVRQTDVVCRVGGEEFAVILPSGDLRSSTALAERIGEQLGKLEAEAVGRLSASTGIAVGPENAANPRELVACAEAAMMTAKTRGKGLIVPFDESARERPSEEAIRRDDVRSIAHLKMLQSLSGKLSRLNDVAQIGLTIADELRLLVDYHNCRVFLRDDDDLVLVAFRGDLTGAIPGDPTKLLPTNVGRGITGRVAETGISLLVGDAAQHEFGEQIEGTAEIEESLLAVPLKYGARVTGVIVISKLGLDQFDADDLRLLEVMAGHASVALENARLYEAQRREAEGAKALLAFSRELAEASSIADVAERATAGAAGILASPSMSVWLQSAITGSLERLACVPEPADGAPFSIPAEHLEPWLARTEPYTVDPDDYAAIAPVPRGHRRTVRDRAVHGRRALGCRRRRRQRSVGSGGSGDGAAGEHRAPDTARAADGGELRDARAHVPLDRGGARKRPRGQRRVHVVPRPLDHRPRTAGRRGARPRRAGPQAPRARRPVPRHRQDRDPVTHPCEAGPAHR